MGLICRPYEIISKVRLRCRKDINTDVTDPTKLWISFSYSRRKNGQKLTPSSRDIINHLRPIATLHDSLGNELQAAELWSAIKHLEKSGLPAPGSQDAKRLDELLEGLDDFLDESGYQYLAKEVRDLRSALDE